MDVLLRVDSLGLVREARVDHRRYTCRDTTLAAAIDSAAVVAAMRWRFDRAKPGERPTPVSTSIPFRIPDPPAGQMVVVGCVRDSVTKSPRPLADILGADGKALGRADHTGWFVLKGTAAAEAKKLRASAFCYAGWVSRGEALRKHGDELTLLRLEEHLRGPPGAMSLRVLHAPAEIAGQASVLAQALRDLGVEAHSLATNPGFPQYTPDEMRPYDAWPPLPRYLGYLGNLLRHAGRWDVYHFHFGRTLVPPHNPDLPLYQALGRAVVFHYHGCDIRNRIHMLEHTRTRPAPSAIRSASRRGSARSWRARAASSIGSWSRPRTCSSPLRAPRICRSPRTSRATRSHRRQGRRGWCCTRPPTGSSRAPATSSAPTTRCVRAFPAPASRSWSGSRGPSCATGSPRPTSWWIRCSWAGTGWWRSRRWRWASRCCATSAKTSSDDSSTARSCGARRRICRIGSPSCWRTSHGAGALGEAGRRYVEREHAAPVIARRLLDLYRSIRPGEPVTDGRNTAHA